MALIIKSLTQKDTGKQWDSTGRIDTIDDPTRHNGPSANTGAVSGGSTPSASAYVAPVKRPGFVKGIGENVAAGGYEALEDLNPARVYHGIQAATNYASGTTFRDLANGALEEDGEAALIGSKFMTTPERQAAFARKAEEATARGNEEIEKFKAVDNWLLPKSSEQEWVQDAQAAREDQNSSAASRFFNSLAYSGGRMLPTMAVGAVTGGAANLLAGGAAAGASAAAASNLASSVASSATIFSNVYTNSLKQNLEAGMEGEVAVNKAMGDALVEASTEILVGGMPGMGKGLVSGERMAGIAERLASNPTAINIALSGSPKLIDRFGAKAVQALVVGADFFANNPLGEFLFDAIGEGAEEVIAEALGPVVNRAVLGSNYSEGVDLDEQLKNPMIAELLSTENPTLAEYGQAWLSGALLSAFSNGAAKVAKRITSNVGKPKAPYMEVDKSGNVAYVDPAKGTKTTIDMSQVTPATSTSAQTPQTQPAPAQAQPAQAQVQQTQSTRAPANPKVKVEPAPATEPTPNQKYKSTIQAEVVLINKGAADGITKAAFKDLGVAGYDIEVIYPQFLPEPLVYNEHMTQEDVDNYVKSVVEPTIKNMQDFLLKSDNAKAYDDLIKNYPMAEVDANWIDDTKVDPVKKAETVAALNQLRSKKGLTQEEWNKALSAVAISPETLLRGLYVNGTADTIFGKGASDVYNAKRDTESSKAKNHKGATRGVARYVKKNGEVELLRFNDYVRLVTSSDSPRTRDYRGKTWNQLTQKQKNTLEDRFAQLKASATAERDTAIKQLNTMLPEGTTARLAKPGEIEAMLKAENSKLETALARKIIKDDGTIELVFNPFWISSRPAVALAAGHEVVHAAAEMAKADEGKSLLNLHEAVADLAKAMGYDYSELYALVKKEEPNLAPDVVEEEVDARFISYMLMSNGFLADLADSGAGGNAAIKSIRAMLEGHLADAPDSEITRKQRQIIADMTDALNGTLREKVAARAANTVPPEDIAPAAPATASVEAEDDDSIPGIDDVAEPEANATAGVFEPNAAPAAQTATEPAATEEVIASPEPTVEPNSEDFLKQSGFAPIASADQASTPAETAGTDANANRTPRLVTDAYSFKKGAVPKILQDFKVRYDYNHDRIEIVKPSNYNQLSKSQQQDRRDALRSIGAAPTHQWIEKNADGEDVLVGVPGLWRIRRDAAAVWSQLVDAPAVSDKQLRDSAKEIEPNTTRQYSPEQARANRLKRMAKANAENDIVVVKFPGIDDATIELAWGRDARDGANYRFVISKPNGFSNYEKRWLSQLGFYPKVEAAFDGVEQLVFTKKANLDADSINSKLWEAAKAGNVEALKPQGVRPAYASYPFMDSPTLVMEYVRDSKGGEEVRVHSKSRRNSTDRAMDDAALESLGFRYDRQLNRYVKGFDANEWVDTFKGPALTADQLNAANVKLAEDNTATDHFKSLNWNKANGDGYGGYQYARDLDTDQILLRKYNRKTKSYDYMAAPYSADLLNRIKSKPNATEGVFEPTEVISAEEYGDDSLTAEEMKELEGIFRRNGENDQTPTASTTGKKSNAKPKKKDFLSAWVKTDELPGTAVTTVSKNGKARTSKPLRAQMRVNYLNGTIEFKLPKNLEITNNFNTDAKEAGNKASTAVMRMLYDYGFRASLKDPTIFVAPYTNVLYKDLGGTPIEELGSFLERRAEAYKRRQAERAAARAEISKQGKVVTYTIDDIAKRDAKLAKEKSKRPSSATILGLGTDVSSPADAIEKRGAEFEAEEDAREKELKANSKLSSDGKKLSTAQQKFFAQSTGTKTADGKLIQYYAQETAAGNGLTPTDGSFGTGYYFSTEEPSTPANVRQVYVLSERPVMMYAVYTSADENGRRQLVIPATKVSTSEVNDVIDAVKKVAESFGYSLEVGDVPGVNVNVKRYMHRAGSANLLLGDFVKELAHTALLKSGELNSSDEAKIVKQSLMNLGYDSIRGAVKSSNGRPQPDSIMAFNIDQIRSVDNTTPGKIKNPLAASPKKTSAKTDTSTRNYAKSNFDIDEYNDWYADYVNRVGIDRIADEARTLEAERYAPEEDFDIDEYNDWYADYVNRVGIDRIADEARALEAERYAPEEDEAEAIQLANALYAEHIFDVEPKIGDMEVFDAMDPNVVDQITNGGDLTDEAALAFLRYYNEVEDRLSRWEFDEGADEASPDSLWEGETRDLEDIIAEYDNEVDISEMSPEEFDDFVNNRTGEPDWEDVYRSTQSVQDPYRSRSDSRNLASRFSAEDVNDLLELTGFGESAPEESPDFYGYPPVNESLFDTEDESELDRQWQYQGEKHGTYEDTTVPKAVADDGSYVSKGAATFYENALKESAEAMTVAERKAILDGAASFTTVTDADARRQAANWIIQNSTQTANGYQLDVPKAFAQISNIFADNGGSFNKLQEAKAMMFAKVVANTPNPTAEDLVLMTKLATMLESNVHYAAQTVQGYGMLKTLGPLAKVYAITSGLDSLKAEMEKLAKKGGINQKAYQQAAKNLADWTIPQNLIDAIANAKTEEERIKAEDNLKNAIADQIPPTPAMRLRAWRFLAMLGNFRTPIRNIAGNVAQGGMKILANQASGIMQDARATKGDVFERTNSRKYRPTTEIKQFARDYYSTIQHALDGTDKYSMESDIMRRVNAFGAKSDIGKFFMALPNLANKGTNWMLNNEKFGDAAFLKAHFQNAFANYLAANAKRWTGSDNVNAVLTYLREGGQEANDNLNKAVDYSVQEALKATFRDASKLANTLNSLAKDNALADVLISGIIPFKKTPINIAKRGLHDYSPVGLVEHILKAATGKIGTEVGRGSNTHTYTEAEAINGIAEGLTGTSALLLGVLGGVLGIIKPSGGDDRRAENYEKMLGNQEYSVTIGGVNYTVDWLTPTSIPLMAGAELGQMYANRAANTTAPDGEDLSEAIDAVITVATHMADPMTDLSVLSGVSDALNAAKYSDSGAAAIGDIMASGAQSLASQYIPTIFGQTARVIDPVRRDAYNADDKTDVFLNRMRNKLPNGTDELEPYVDLWGRNEQNVGAFGDTDTLSRIAGQAFTPWYAREVNVTKVDDQLSELFAESGTSKVLPQAPAKKTSYSNGDYKYKPSEYTWVKENEGQLKYKGVASAFDSRYFDQLSTSEKADVISDIYTYAGYETKNEFATQHPDEVTYTNSTGINTVKRVETAEMFGLSVGDYYSIKSLLSKNGITKDKDKKRYLTLLGLNEAQMLPFMQEVPKI